MSRAVVQPALSRAARLVCVRDRSEPYRPRDGDAVRASFRGYLSTYRRRWPNSASPEPMTWSVRGRCKGYAGSALRAMGDRCDNVGFEAVATPCGTRDALPAPSSLELAGCVHAPRNWGFAICACPAAVGAVPASVPVVFVRRVGVFVVRVHQLWLVLPSSPPSAECVSATGMVRPSCEPPSSGGSSGNGSFRVSSSGCAGPEDLRLSRSTERGSSQSLRAPSIDPSCPGRTGQVGTTGSPCAGPGSVAVYRAVSFAPVFWFWSQMSLEPGDSSRGHAALPQRISSGVSKPV